MSVLRSLARGVSHTNLKRAGLRNVNKHDYSTYTTTSGATIQERIPSYFAKHWRDTVNVPTIDLRRKSSG